MIVTFIYINTKITKEISKLRHTRIKYKKNKSENLHKKDINKIKDFAYSALE